MKRFGDESRKLAAAKLEIWAGLFCGASAILLLCLTGPREAVAQGSSGGRIESIFVSPVDAEAVSGGARSAELHERLVERLGQDKKLHLASDAASADAMLRVKAVIWPTGTVTLNPRSRAGSFTNYEGYATAYLYAPQGGTGGGPGQVLWTYLATPKRFRFDGIVDDLSAQIAEALSRTVANGLPAVSTAPRGSVGGLEVAGATFPAPLYLKWFQAFGMQQGGVPMTYDAVGSVRGVEELAAGKIDMAASDIPASGPEAGTLRVPSVVGAIVPIYNLSGSSSGGGSAAQQDLDLTGPLLADIYSGKITRWDDPAIAAANHGVRLPHAAIAVIHRSDGSGTTFVWTSFLAHSSGDWKQRVGAEITWPTGTGVAGNEGMAEEVAKTPNSIGYVELAYAIQHRLNYAAVRNPAGRAIKADLDSVSAAAEAAAGTSNASLIDSAAKDAYPITTFTWLVVPQPIRDPSRRASAYAFLHWMLTSGQRQCAPLGYAPLPKKIANEELRQIDALK